MGWKRLRSIIIKVIMSCRVKLYSKTCLMRPLRKKIKNDFQDWLSLNAGQKYCRMLQGEHSAKILTFIKVPFVIKIFVFSIFEWPLKAGFTVFSSSLSCFPMKTPWDESSKTIIKLWSSEDSSQSAILSNLLSLIYEALEGFLGIQGYWPKS